MRAGYGEAGVEKKAEKERCGSTASAAWVHRGSGSVMLLAVVAVVAAFAMLSMMMLQMEIKLARRQREIEKNEYLLELALVEMRAGLSIRAGEVWAECAAAVPDGMEDREDEEGQGIAEVFCERMLAELGEDSAAEYLKGFSVTLEEEFLEVEAKAAEVTDGEIVIPEVCLTYMPAGRKTKAKISVDLALRTPEGAPAEEADTEETTEEGMREEGICPVVVKRWLYAPRVR